MHFHVSIPNIQFDVTSSIILTRCESLLSNTPRQGHEHFQHTTLPSNIEPDYWQASSKDEALQVAIKAAEHGDASLETRKGSGRERSNSQLRLKQLLEEAELIKQSPDWRETIESTTGTGSGSSSNMALTRQLKEPQSTRELPKQEQIMLLRASYLNGFKFPPWTTIPKASEFELKDGDAPFTYVILSCTSLAIR